MTDTQLVNAVFAFGFLLGLTYVFEVIRFVDNFGTLKGWRRANALVKIGTWTAFFLFVTIVCGRLIIG